MARASGWLVGIFAAVLLAYALPMLLRGEHPELFAPLMAVFLTFSGLRELYLAPEVVRLRVGVRFVPRWLRGSAEPSEVRRAGRLSLLLGLLWWVLVLLGATVLR